jgi:hypothetical protein
MPQLVFITGDKVMYERECILFKARCGSDEVSCGVTTYALQYRDPDLPTDGLVPSEAFLDSFERFKLEIHQAARRKFERGEFEPEGDVKVMVHRKDLCR